MKLIIRKTIFIIFIFFIIFSTDNIYASEWIKVDASDDEKIWIDTSHWENKRVWVQDGYYRDIQKREWVDTSHTVSQGYWRTEQYDVWVQSSTRVPYLAYRWIDTSHWEQRYRYVTSWIPINLTIYVGTSSYGWNVYSFAQDQKRDCTIQYRGNRYRAHKWVIDYRPSYGGRVYAVKYVCFAKESRVRQYYNVWVRSGYYQSYIDYRTIDASHWETRTRQVWVDTSYTVNSGYWRQYTEREWVDTSHYENQAVWVEDGFYSSPLHGEVTIEKDPKYVFTKWHINGAGEQCSMDLKVSWVLDNTQLLPGEEEKEITRIVIYEDVIRYNKKGTDRVEIMDKSISPSKQGSVESISYFDYSGTEESLVHILLYAQNGECAHIYFNNPINGYRSINLGSGGTDNDANKWLGGNFFGKIEF